MSTTQETILDKKAKIKSLYDYHIPLFKKLNVNNPYFLAKVSYIDSKLKEKVVSFFPNEIKEGTDIYMEFTSKDYNIEDEDRVLYKWTYNPWYADEYQLSEPHNATAARRYLVPVAELTAYKNGTPKTTVEDVTPFSDKRYINTSNNSKTLNTIVKEELDFELPNADLDLPFDQLTIRDLAAILLRKPVSMKPWLNEIINNK